MDPRSSVGVDSLNMDPRSSVRVGSVNMDLRSIVGLEKRSSEILKK